jgi:hypothetical protein
VTLAVTTVLLARGRALSSETQVLVDDELAGNGVTGSTESEANDDSERVQLRRDLLELSESLRDSVALDLVSIVQLKHLRILVRSIDRVDEARRKPLVITHQPGPPSVTRNLVSD